MAEWEFTCIARVAREGRGGHSIARPAHRAPLSPTAPARGAGAATAAVVALAALRRAADLERFALGSSELINAIHTIVPTSGEGAPCVCRVCGSVCVCVCDVCVCVFGAALV